MTVREIRNILWNTPHRCNDEHVEYLLQCLDNLEEHYNKLDEEYNALMNQQREHSQKMVGGWLTLLLNKPEIFTKE